MILLMRPYQRVRVMPPFSKLFYMDINISLFHVTKQG